MEHQSIGLRIFNWLMTSEYNWMAFLAYFVVLWWLTGDASPLP